MRTVVWRGLDAPRMEIARVEREGGAVVAFGSQIGVAYELRYELEGDRLSVDVVGGRRAAFTLDGADFFDLGFSPLFNSLPVWRDGLLDGGPARDYVMRWVSVPGLELEESRQRYEPLGAGAVRFSEDAFVADLEFDADGVVTRYEGLAERVG